MTRIDGGSCTSSISYERHESVGPGSNTTAGPDSSPCATNDSVMPLPSVTLEGAGLTVES